MAKMKKQNKWDNCQYALYPFGKSMPLCSYGMKLTDELRAKDFPLCMYKNICLKEQTEKN